VKLFFRYILDQEKYPAVPLYVGDKAGVVFHDDPPFTGIYVENYVGYYVVTSMCEWKIPLEKMMIFLEAESL